jgi:hypothetical protein
LQRRRYTGERSPQGDSETESSRYKEAPSQSAESGELPKGLNVDDYSRYLSSILAGLSVQAANGSTKAQLKPLFMPNKVVTSPEVNWADSGNIWRMDARRNKWKLTEGPFSAGVGCDLTLATRKKSRADQCIDRLLRRS